jgi:hypothetical protein
VSGPDSSEVAERVGLPSPIPKISKNTVKQGISKKNRRRFATTAVYHRFGLQGLVSRRNSSAPQTGRDTSSNCRLYASDRANDRWSGHRRRLTLSGRNGPISPASAGESQRGQSSCLFSFERCLYDLFAHRIDLDLPRHIGWSASRLGNPVCCLSRPPQRLPASVLEFEHKGIRGFRAVTPDGHSIAIVAERTSSTLGCDSVLLVPGARSLPAVAGVLAEKKGQWLYPKTRRAGDDALADASRLPEAIAESWRNRMVLKAEDQEEGLPGLRSPQIGAVYAALAHWSTSDKPATVVMPTGTGKTETMLALLVAARLRFRSAEVKAWSIRMGYGGTAQLSPPTSPMPQWQSRLAEGEDRT